MNDNQPMRDWLALARGTLGPSSTADLVQLPVALLLAEAVMEDTVQITPRVLVREEKNKGSSYHGQTLNMTFHTQRKDHTSLLWQEFPMSATLDMTDVPPAILQGHGGALMRFIDSFTPVQPDAPLGSATRFAWADGTAHDVQFKRFTLPGLDADRTVTVPASDDGPEYMRGPLAVTDRDLAVWTALRARLIELAVSENVEIYGTQVDAAVRSQNAAILGQVLQNYVAFLIHVVVAYGEPHFEG